MALRKQIELDFTDFATLLITETFDAIISSLRQQQGKYLEIKNAAALSLADFIKLYITDEITIEEMIKLFGPSVKSPGVSAAHAGEPYAPGGGESLEKPGIYAQCGYKMQNDDYKKSKKEIFITEQGESNIKSATAIVVGRRMQEYFKSLADNGVPRIQVDSGKISARLSVRVEERQSGEDGYSKRMVVRPVSATSPDILNKKANLAGELEINFRTII